MKTEFRNRVFLPIVMPLAILLGMAAFIGVFALLLLNNTHEGGLALAIVAAAGILLTVSLAANQDRLDGPRKGVLLLAVATPFALGALMATGVLGGIAPEAKMINVEPAMEAPEDAILAAENAQEFCAPQEDGSCEPTESWEVGQQEGEQFIYEFDNRDDGVLHNLSVNELASDGDDPEGGEQLIAGTEITGPATVTDAGDQLEPGEYFFVCDIHPSTMTGVLTVAEGDGGGSEGA